MATVRDLLPGDLVTTGTGQAVFMSSCPHPVYEGKLLVVWRTGDGGTRLDTLRPGDEVGDVQPTEPAARAARLSEALS